MTRLIGIYGAAGHGRETMPLVLEQLDEDAQVVFVDDGAAPAKVGVHDVVDFDTFVGMPAARKSVAIAIGDGAVRARLAEKCAAAGLSFETVIASDASVGERVELGEGAILSTGALVTVDVSIGRHFHLNINASVSHDCVIGDFVTFGPRATCNGNVHIGNGAYIGAGALIRQGTPEEPMTIGEGAVVGMGAVVTKPVPAGATVVGNPARIMER